LATVEFIFNNKVHTTIKLLSFNSYERKLRIGFELRKKGENVKAEEFVKKIKNMYEKAKVTLKKLHKEIKKICKQK